MITGFDIRNDSTISSRVRFVAVAGTQRLQALYLLPKTELHLSMPTSEPSDYGAITNYHGAQVSLTEGKRALMHPRAL